MLEAVNAEIMLLLFACFLVVSDAGDVQAVHYFEKTADDGSSIRRTQKVIEMNKKAQLLKDEFQ